MKPLLVGLDNPHGTSHLQALLPVPKGCTGDRLRKMIAEYRKPFTVSDYMKSFDRINLYPHFRAASGKGAFKFDRAMAQWLLVYVIDRGYDDVFLLGNRVQAAMSHHVGLTCEDLETTEYTRPDGSTMRFHCFPHPSGRNTKYNDREFRMEAARCLTYFI